SIEFVKQLSGVARNVNQLTKSVHEGSQAFAAIEEIRKEIKTLFEISSKL
ncbi:MAG: plasmid mobilization relaxosome protein MobC, partial [Proteobacteria bacterium]